MHPTSKWYCKNMSSQLNYFKSLSQMIAKVRCLTKITTDILKFDGLEDHKKIIREYEAIFLAYKDLQQEQQNTFSTIKKIKRSPYKSILTTKLKLLTNLNNKGLQQLIFILREMLFISFKKSTDSNALITWALDLVSVYNKCSKIVNELQRNELTSNICSNTFPSLLLPQANMDFGVILTLVSQRRIEQNILDMLHHLFNVEACQELKKYEYNSNSSTLEILKILTHNITTENESLKYSNVDTVENYNESDVSSTAVLVDYNREKENAYKHNDFSSFIKRESIYLSNLISECKRIAPSALGEKQSDLEELKYDDVLKDGLRIVWTYISTMLDHVILWWIETPMCCYSLSYVDSIRSWLFSDGCNGTQEPVHSSLKALCEILTIYVSNNVWDRMFRITLVTSSHSRSKDIGLEDNLESGTTVGKVWSELFNHLKIFNNNFLLTSETTSNQLAVAEQIPILHRIDHSIHSMRIWVKEQSKLQSSQWVIDVVFQVLNYDVRNCLDILSLIDCRTLTMEHTDILMTVCISLRAKLVLEINANILKLKNARDECIKVLSSVCRTLSLANFSLCFPPRQQWQVNFVKDSKSGYVPFVLDQIFLPALKSTNDITILELILKILCEAWIDYIYSQKIKFSVSGALTLLNDFDEVREWISKIDFIPKDYTEKLSNHEVLRMCKGVGKVLVRKPNEMISIVHSPKYVKSSFEQSSQETQLPSEMFVSNQSNWLQLRAPSSKLWFCCQEN